VFAKEARAESGGGWPRAERLLTTIAVSYGREGGREGGKEGERVRRVGYRAGEVGERGREGGSTYLAMEALEGVGVAGGGGLVDKGVEKGGGGRVAGRVQLIEDDEG